LALLPEIFRLYSQMVAEHNKVALVKVISATPLTDEYTDKLTQKLSVRFSREVQLIVEVDTALMGGIIVEYGDTVIDGSVRGKLTRLAENM
jgi:F-type H+-transporting ATPase subunit delta